MLKSLGKFRIISEVGRGAMGVVYRAEDNLGRAVALKVPPPSLAVDKELLQRFNREARSAASLKHDNIVWIMESSEIDATPYIAMEFIEGETLAQIISSRRAMPIVRKLDIIIQTCRGLQYAHKKQVVHRDIKPSNIMVEHDGPVKIVDFGIAHLSGGTLLTLTQEGQRLGTPSYMSPEQTKGQPADPRSDIFSVGVVLFELLTYQKPFLGDEIGVVWYKIQNEPPAPLAELLPTCPPELQKVVNKALAKNREDRYQTAEDLGFALQQVSDYFKHDMIEVYVQEGRRHLEEGNLTVAKESIQRALEIDSSHDVARSLFDQVQGQIEARRRAQRVEQIFRQAKEVLEADQFDEAVRLLDEVLQLDPSHREAPQYRSRAIDGRERGRQISQHMARAERLIADADLKGAKNELEAVLKLDGAQSAAQKKLDSVLKELAEQEREQQVRQHIQDARKLLAQKKFDQAGDLLEKALVLDPINIEAEALLRQVRSGQEKEKERQRREGRMAGIQEALNRQDIAHALALTEQALEDFPGDSQIFRLHAQATRLAELEKRRRSIEEQLQLARSFVQKDQYDEAIGVLERALEQFPDEARLTTYLETIREAREQAHIERLRIEAARRAGALIREKKFAPAIGALEEALARAGESREILELLKFAREQQAEQQKEERARQVIVWAEICLREQNFEEALRVLAEARRESSSPDLDALQATVSEQQQQFEQRRAEMMRQARRSLEAGEAAAAVALLESGPKACFKYEEFRQLHAQCRAGLDRAAAIRGAAAEVEKAAVEGNLDHAQKLLQQALDTYPNEAALLAAQERLRAEEVGRQRDGWRKLIDQAKAAIDRKDYERTMGILAALPPELSKAPELAAEGRDLQEQALQGTRALALRQEAIQAANEHIGNNQFALAVATLEKASAEAGESPELAKLLRSARDRRDDRARQAIGKAQGLLAEDAYAEAIRILEQSEKNLGTNEISALLARARDREREFGLRRQETLQQARRLLEAGDAAKAAALLDAAPKAYVKDAEFQGLYTQCREKLELAKFVSSTRMQVENCLESRDLVHAEDALRQALGRYPEEPVFLALRARLGNERSRLRRLEWTKHVEDATLALDRTDYAGALEALEALPSEVSEEPDLASKAQALRAKAAQIERRTAARRQALDEAKRWISADDFAAAIEVLERAEARDGPSPELKELLEYARLRKIEHERQGRVRQLQVKVQQFLVEDNYDEARRVLEQAQGLLETPEIEAQLATVRERQRKFEERQKQTLARVRQLLAAGKAAEAQSVLDSAPKAFFKNEEFSHVNAECKEQVARSAFVQSHLKQFEAFIGAQDFARAEALLERAFDAYPQDAEFLVARKRLEDARLRWREAQWSKVIDEARTAIAQMAFQRAIDLLAALTPEIGASPRLGSQAAALLDEARQKEKAAAIGREAARAAQEQLKQGEHLRAIETLERALAVAGSSPEVDRLLKLAREQAEQARQERIRSVLDRARQLQKSNQHQEAVSFLEQARRELSAKEINSLLSEAREQLRLVQQRDEILRQARALLAAGNAVQALALLDSAPKAFLEDVEFSRLHADCGERVRRAEFISSTGARFEAFFSSGDVAQARTALDGGLKKYPNEPALLALEKRLKEEESRLERAERVRQVERARAALERQEYGGALEILKALPADLSETPELVSVVPELLERARRMEQQALRRQQAIREASEQIRNNQYARAIATLETAAAKAGSSTETDALLRSAQEGVRRERDHHRDQLLAIELKIPSTRKSKLKGLQHQVQQIAAGYSADDELASIAARVQQRIAAAIAAPRKPFPWRRVALGAAVVAVLGVGAELGFRLIKPPEQTKQTVRVVILSDPPGASVRIGEKSCNVPYCKFDLSPGRYTIQAKLDGYQPYAEIHTLDSQQPVTLRLRPLPLPPPPPNTVVGTLVVQARLPDATVYVDDRASGRTDEQGIFSAQLEAKRYHVRVQKNGYETPRPQQADITKGKSQFLSFNLLPQPAKLDLQGAPAGVEIRLGATLLGRTDGSQLFPVAVPPGQQTLLLAQGSATRQITQEFAPGQTVAMDWPSVAPRPMPKPSEPPSPEALESRAWQQVRQSSDPAPLEDFLKKHPSGPHTAEAETKLQDLTWARTNRDDIGALQAYLKRFPNGPHSGEASRGIEEVVWNGLDKKDGQALRVFIGQYPNASHFSEAQSILKQIEAARAQPKQPPASLEEPAIRAALDRFNAAFKAGQPRELKLVWPTVPGRYTEAMRVPGSTFVMTLHPVGEAVVDGDAASIPCELDTRTTVNGSPPSRSQRTGNVTLHKDSDHWTIVNVLGAG